MFTNIACFDSIIAQAHIRHTHFKQQQQHTMITTNSTVEIPHLDNRFWKVLEEKKLWSRKGNKCFRVSRPTYGNKLKYVIVNEDKMVPVEIA